MRKISLAKSATATVATPAIAKAAATAKPVTTTAPAKPDKPAKPAATITRTAATVAKQATNYNSLSDRDNAYLAFYATFAKRLPTGRVTLADIVSSGARPTYNGSNKPHDAGVLVRLTKAGYIVPADAGHAFTFTAAGKALAVYTKA